MSGVKVREKVSLHIEISREIATWLEEESKKTERPKAHIVEEALRLRKNIQEKINEGLTLLQQDEEIIKNITEIVSHYVKGGLIRFLSMRSSMMPLYGIDDKTGASVRVSSFLGEYYFLCFYRGRLTNPIIEVTIRARTGSIAVELQTTKLEPEDLERIASALTAFIRKPLTENDLWMQSMHDLVTAYAMAKLLKSLAKS